MMKVLDKTQRMNDLLDQYGKLLTKKQYEIMHLHYQEDLSLSEISEELNISKAAASDTIRKCELRLEKLESELGLMIKSEQRNIIYEQLNLITPANQKLVKKLQNLETSEIKEDSVCQK